MVTSTPASTPMLSRTHSVAQSAKSPQIQSQAEVRAAKAEAALEEVKKDFEIYREEKSTHEKMLSESLESTRTELGESRAKSMKLGTIHILRKHFYSKKLNLTSKFFTKTERFLSKQKNFIFNIVF